VVTPMRVSHALVLVALHVSRFRAGMGDAFDEVGGWAYLTSTLILRLCHDPAIAVQPLSRVYRLCVVRRRGFCMPSCRRCESAGRARSFPYASSGSHLSDMRKECLLAYSESQVLRVVKI
jgi:hypothetical protein